MTISTFGWLFVTPSTVGRTLDLDISYELFMKVASSEERDLRYYLAVH